ncbi:alternative NAD(P)H dehydrogenase 2, mitochondrial [Haematococcus lacustris]|uniref:Alternative NAD(P)H dehydrogenase 2, mitochondrial n=1 Tax=Haematococcus lacustris TaxID=44745 RepID=A0A699ZIH7_HAELA|nr:alternative NAD(P)H dehydrogenase 2, mitochondrial [Haematococcus lacustris]
MEEGLVVLGTGWGGARLLHDIKPQLYDLTVISTRNHMVFTPLLASTTVGTLDPRSVAGVTLITRRYKKLPLERLWDKHLVLHHGTAPVSTSETAAGSQALQGTLYQALSR